MNSEQIESADIYQILTGWATQHLGQQPEAGSELAAYLSDQSQALAHSLQENTTLKVKLQSHGLALQQVLQRCAVEAWRDFHLARPEYTEVPARCPSCSELLAGQWTCAMCGLELFRWQKLDPRSSFDSLGYLPAGYVLAPDPRRNRLIFLELAQKPEVVWQVTLPARLSLNPRSVLFLPGQEILLATPEGQVVICDLFGQIVWECTYPLKKPVFAGASRDGQEIMIADQGLHQVLVINRQNELLWLYGKAGQSGKEAQYLNQPSAVFRTAEGTYLVADSGNRRVLEISELSLQIRRQLALNQQLEMPYRVERLANGHTVILDINTFRLIELNAEHQLHDVCTYYQQSLDPRYRVQDAFAATRRENGNYVISNAERMVEINPLQKRLLWFSLLTDLRLPVLPSPPPPPVATRPEAPASPRPSLPSTGLRSPFQLDEALKQVSVFESAPPEFFEKIKLCLRYEEFPAGHILMREGQRGDTMYLIKDGEVEILKEFQTIAVLKRGDIFGEMALLSQEPRNATVRVRSNCRVYRLNRLAFETVVQAFPDVHQRIKALASARQLAEASASATPITKAPLASSQESAKERLQKLMESHKQRLEEIRKKPREAREHKLAEGPLHWKLRYSPLEQHLIQEARLQNYKCLELHVQLSSHCQMKSARVSLLVMNLEKYGEIIKTHPLPEEILKEQLDSQVVLTLLTRTSRSTVIEEASAVAEIDKVHAIPVQF